MERVQDGIGVDVDRQMLQVQPGVGGREGIEAQTLRQDKAVALQQVALRIRQREQGLLNPAEVCCCQCVVGDAESELDGMLGAQLFRRKCRHSGQGGVDCGGR